MVPQRPSFERQPGLGALQSLNLALFVHTQHNRLVGRIQTEADHIREFFEEFWA